MHMCSLSLGNFVSLCEWAHLPDKTVPTALTQQYTKLVVKFSAQPPPSELSSEAWTYHSRSKQIPLCRALTVGGNAIEWIPDWLSVWLFYCLSFCLSVWPVDMQLHKYPQQEQQQQLRFRLLFRALCRHTHFRGKPLPFLHRAAPIYCLYCLFLSFMCFFVCVSTVCLAATCSPQAKILVLTIPLPSSF